MGHPISLEWLESRTLFSVYIDPSFGAHGILDLGTGGVRARATQDDGKILIAGTRAFHLPDEPGIDLTRAFVTRLLPDGTLDSSFGGEAHAQPTGTPDGTVVFTDRGILQHINQIGSLPDGGVLIAGDRRVAMNVDGAMIKLEPNGVLDPGFGGHSTGYKGTSAGVSFYSDGPFSQIAVADDGRIAVVVPPTADNPASPTKYRSQILMFNQTGTVDTDFATNGIYTETTNAGSVDRFDAMTFTSDGVLIASRVTYSPGSQSTAASINLSLFDLTDEGKPGPADDATVFGAVGLKVPTNLFANEFAPLPDGSFLLLASQRDYKELAIYHVLGNVTLDSTFGPASGQANFVIPDGETFSYPSLAVMPDGRFYVSAFTLVPGELHIERFLPDGGIDPIFGDAIVDQFPASTQLITPSGDDVILIAQTQASEIALAKIEGSVRISRSAAGTLLVGGISTDDDISLYIRHSDGRLVARDSNLAKSFKRSSVKRIRIYSYGGDDSIVVGSGVGAFFADAGPDADTITGGAGADTLLGNTGPDHITGGDGDDSISGGGGNDVLSGGNGNDSLAGNGGHDTLNGDDGDDVLFGGPGFADTINGGAGNDLAAQDFSDKYTGVETLV